MANIITICRIFCGLMLLFVPALSPGFYFLYLAAGFTDMIDGTVARKTNTVSKLGSKLDFGADFVFVAACFIKLLPIMNIPVWLWVWISLIAVKKAVNIISGYVIWKEMVVKHTVLNKITGAVLFICPFTIAFVEIKYSGIIICIIATIAAMQEGYLIRTSNNSL